LAAFVFLIVIFAGSAVRESVTGTSTGRGAGLLAMVPVIAVAALALTYWRWDRWWLAVVLGLVSGVLGAAVLGAAVFPDLADGDLAGAKEPDRRSYMTGGPS
jgi:hypothetical protein